MIEILLTACMITEPARCREVHLTYAAEAVTPHQCIMGAMPEISKWLVDHPKWKAAKWKCQSPGQVAKI